MPLLLLTPKSIHPDSRDYLCNALRAMNYDLKSITGVSVTVLLDEVFSVLSSHQYLSASRWILVRPTLGCVKEWWLAGDAKHWAAVDCLIAAENGLIVEYELERSIDDRDEFVMRMASSRSQQLERLLTQINGVN